MNTSTHSRTGRLSRAAVITTPIVLAGGLALAGTASAGTTHEIARPFGAASPGQHLVVPPALRHAIATRLGAAAARNLAAGHAQPQGWPKGTQTGEVQAPAPGGFFGSTVAMSPDGMTAFIGAYYVNGGSGAVYVYQNEGGTWTLTQTLTGSDEAGGDYFGSSFGLSGNGKTLAVGSWGHNGQTGSGYVFQDKQGTWKQTQELTASDGVQSDAFGTGVALSKNGSTVAIGANGRDNAEGAIYVFTKGTHAYHQTDTLTASDATDYAQIGSAMSMSADGSTLLAGAYLQGDKFHGAAYVFTNSGGTWNQSAELTAADGQSVDYYGWSVAISADGMTAAVSADDANASTGKIYTYAFDGSTWNTTGEFAGNDTAGGDQFGISVSMSASGKDLVVGSISHNAGDGAVYVFEPKGSSWKQKVEMTGDDASPGDYVGAAVSISGDGSTILGGAWGENNGAGAAYLFSK